MATGDLPGTALFIARELGWKVTEANVLTGNALKAMTDEELKKYFVFEGQLEIVKKTLSS